MDLIVQGNRPEAAWQAYSRVPVRWAEIPEKEKWKVTIGVGLRQLGIVVAIWLVFFLIVVVAM